MKFTPKSKVEVGHNVKYAVPAFIFFTEGLCDRPTTLAPFAVARLVNGLREVHIATLELKGSMSNLWHFLPEGPICIMGVSSMSCVVQ